MKYAWLLAPVSALGLVFLFEPAPARAEKPFPGKMLEHLPLLHKDNQDNCKVCHTQTVDPVTKKKDPKWNVFGDAMHKAKDALKEKTGQAPSFAAMFDAVKDADSDGDGVSNIVELVAGTKPGDKDSKPTDEQAAAAKKQIDEAAAKNAPATPAK